MVGPFIDLPANDRNKTVGSHEVPTNLMPYDLHFWGAGYSKFLWNAAVYNGKQAAQFFAVGLIQVLPPLMDLYLIPTSNASQPKES